MNPVIHVPLPATMLRMKLDRRGYPIPYIVWRDKHNKPKFTVNDARMVKRCLLHNRCGICGDKMGTTVFFVGGPAAALHPNGAYVDPPMHEDCARYALQVCPFIAVRAYKGYAPAYVYDHIEPRKKNMAIVTDTQHHMDGKPDLFLLKGTNGFVNMAEFRAPRLVPTNTTILEYWKDGRMLSEDDPFIDEAVMRALGGVDDAAAARQNVPLRSPMGASMSAYAAALGASS